MKAPVLTVDQHILLIEPDIARDTPLSVQWLEGNEGRQTLRLMGVPETKNRPSTPEQEQERIASFQSRRDQLNWMISYDNGVIGAIWVDLQPSLHLQSPSLHMMIGRPEMRRKGIGTAVMQAVIDYLKKTGSTTIYSRYIVDNSGSAKLSKGLGFTLDGKPYRDAEGLSWQNIVLKLSKA